MHWNRILSKWAFRMRSKTRFRKKKEDLLALPPAARECQEEVAHAVMLAKSARQLGDPSDEVLQRAADEAASGREDWGFVAVDSDSAEEKDGSSSEEKETRLVASTPYCDNPAFDWLIRLKAGKVSYDKAPKTHLGGSKECQSHLD